MEPNTPIILQGKRLRKSLNLITVSGCLAMVYFAGISSPLTTAFFRSLGAQEFHFGIISAIPLAMVSLQFAGAFLTNRVRRRKPLFMAAVIGARLVYLVIAFLPALFSQQHPEKAIVLVLVLLFFASALGNIAGPLWFSWMADLVPRRVLNRYWGGRQRWMQIASTLSLLVLALVVKRTQFPALRLFPLVCVVAVAAGAIDILLFLRVEEPENVRNSGTRPLAALMEPLRHANYRSFIVFVCTWFAVAMFGASFMQLFTLKILGISVWVTSLIWCAGSVGMATASRYWGRIADRFGHRPVLFLCTLLKSGLAATFLLVTPRAASWVLSIAFFLDGILNAGFFISQNGYMLSVAPRKNRSMFIASISGLAGICGGLGAIAGGQFLDSTSGFALLWAGRHWNHYHLLFLVNFFMRICCIPLCYRIREPESARPSQVFYSIMSGWPQRIINFPVGFYKSREISDGRGALDTNKKRIPKSQ